MTLRSPIKPLLPQWACWAENIVIMVGTAVLGITAGRQALLRAGLVNWDGLAAVAHAYDVFHKLPGAHLTLLGFVQPPLPGLVAAGAVALVPRIAQPALLPSIIGAVLLGVGALMIRNIGRQVGLGRYVHGHLSSCLCSVLWRSVMPRAGRRQYCSLFCCSGLLSLSAAGEMGSASGIC